MVELVGDPCLPSEFIVPNKLGGSFPTASGALYMSGAELIFYNGSGPLVVV